MDGSSVELITGLAARAGAHPWLLFLTRRDEETGFVAPDGATVLRPSPLDIRSGIELVTAMTEESPLMPSDVATLVDRSSGNPLFLRQLVAAAHEAGGVAGLPDDVGAMVISQIDRLPAADRRVLRLASVLGMTFEDRHLEALFEGDGGVGADTWRRLSAFLQEEPDGRHRFLHALMRDAAYDGLPFRTRRALHARVAERIEAEAVEPDEWAETLSMHFYLSDMAEQAWRYSRVAGERAWWAFANLEAAEFLRRALEAGQRSGVPTTELVSACELRGDALERANRFGEAITAYRAARRIARGRSARDRAAAAQGGCRQPPAGAGQVRAGDAPPSPARDRRARRSGCCGPAWRDLRGLRLRHLRQSPQERRGLAVAHPR